MSPTPSKAPADVVAEFRRACLGDPPVQQGGIDNLDEILAELYRRGRQAWPDIDLAVDELIGHVARHMAKVDDVAGFLGEIHAEDLYLCAGCTGGDARAIALVIQHYFDEVGKALARLSVDSLNRDDLEQELRLKLFVPQPGKLPKVASYSGRGRLRGWLRVVATRCIVDMLRARRSPEAQNSDEADLQRLPDTANDPELAHLKSLYRDQFAAAFHEALAQLTPKQRNLLRHNVLRGLSIDEIGALYGCHRATAARWLASARRDIYRLTRTSLSKRLRIDRDELASIWRLIQSQLDISVYKYLQPDTEDSASSGDGSDDR